MANPVGIKYSKEEREEQRQRIEQLMIEIGFDAIAIQRALRASTTAPALRSMR